MNFPRKRPTHFLITGVFKLNRPDSVQQKGIPQTTATY